VPGGFGAFSVSFGLSTAMVITMVNVVSELAVEVRDSGDKVLPYGSLGTKS